MYILKKYKCVVCDEDARKNRKFCSTKCMVKYNYELLNPTKSAIPNTICPRCGKEHNKPKYCKNCHEELAREAHIANVTYRQPSNCLQCGKLFKTQFKHQKFCCLECAYIHRQTIPRIAKICPTCKKEYYSKHDHCSVRCRANNPKHNYKFQRGSLAYKQSPEGIASYKLKRKNLISLNKKEHYVIPKQEDFLIDIPVEPDLSEYEDYPTDF